MGIRTLLFFIFLGSSVSHVSFAEPNSSARFFAGARGGFNLIQQELSSVGGGMSLGLEGGMPLGEFGNISASLLTCGFNPYTQVFYYLFGYSKEVIWNISLSGYLGIQRYTKEESTPTNYALPAAASQFAYGFGISYLFPDLFALGDSATVQLIPEGMYYVSSGLKWYGGMINARFNFH